MRHEYQDRGDTSIRFVCNIKIDVLFCSGGMVAYEFQILYP